MGLHSARRGRWHPSEGVRVSFVDDYRRTFPEFDELADESLDEFEAYWRQLRAGLELRRSNAAQRHRNRYRERKAGQDGAEWLAEYEAEIDHLEPKGVHVRRL